MLTPLQLRVALEQALVTLEAHGVPPELVVLGFTNPHDSADGTDYESHVGATRDPTAAVLVQMVAAEMHDEARRAAVALVRREHCPACGSPRLAFLQRRRDPKPGQPPGVYVETLDDCLDCDYRAER